MSLQKSRAAKGTNMFLKKILLVTVCSAVFGNSAVADVGSDLVDFWEKSGGSVSVNEGFSYMGQRAGYATLGSVQIRTRTRQSELLNIQLPSVRAGCGGIDLFGGSFSFISKEELIAMMEAIMQNASAFAFELALESMSPAVQETVAKLRDLMQQVNSMNINSCEAGQALTASLWPQMEGASSHVCTTMGSYQGLFADQIASRHGCGTGGSSASTLSQANGALKEQVPYDVNYAWKAIQKNAFLASDRRLSEFFMTLTGTIITTAPPNDNEGPKHRPIAPRAGGSDMVSALIEGGSVQILRCNETTKCLNPKLQAINIPASRALLTQTVKTISGIRDAIEDGDEKISDEAVALLGMTSVPVLDMLITGMSYQHIFVDSEIQAMAEVVAVDLAMIYIQTALDEMSAAAGRVATMGDITFEFKDSISQTQESFAQLRQLAAERYSAAMRTLERLALAKNELAAYSSSRFASMLGEQ